jgi:hypothetical protein
MRLDRKFIGYEFQPTEEIITRWQVAQFANAIRDFNPIYYDINEARSQGFSDIPCPPTFFTKFTFSGEKNFFETLGIDFKKLLDGGREYNYYTQCLAGDKIMYQTKVENITEKEGKRGKMDVVTAITTGNNKDTNEKIFESICTLVVFH